jgi:plastocyanin
VEPPEPLEVTVRTSSPHRLAAGLSAAALALALTACGSSPSSYGGAADGAPASAGSPSAPPSSAAGVAVTATEADFSITLSSTSLPAGTHQVTVRNDGSATHALTIEGPGGIDVTSDTVQAGESTTLEVTLQPGVYEVYCPIGDHRAMGMDTTLTVT